MYGCGYSVLSSFAWAIGVVMCMHKCSSDWLGKRILKAYCGIIYITTKRWGNEQKNTHKNTNNAYRKTLRHTNKLHAHTHTRTHIECIAKKKEYTRCLEAAENHCCLDLKVKNIPFIKKKKKPTRTTTTCRVSLAHNGYQGWLTGANRPEEKKRNYFDAFRLSLFIPMFNEKKNARFFLRNYWKNLFILKWTLQIVPVKSRFISVYPTFSLPHPNWFFRWMSSTAVLFSLYFKYLRNRQYAVGMMVDTHLPIVSVPLARCLRAI